ncbi:MAG: GTP cyclohydrolase I FolE2 [Euryarchaeota archaeon]|nr:GTP cyclohydrolase I FolE2 [Euryarchaeota archaeon]
MLPDVQTRAPEIRMPLSRVGVNNVRKLLRVRRGEGKRDIVLLANFECYVDLPSFQKGTHMSRNLEAINEIIERASDRPVYRLEQLCSDVVLEILRRHSYASMSEVSMESRLMVHRRSPLGRATQDFVRLLARARAERGDGVTLTREVGAEIQGIIFHFAGEQERLCTQRARARLSISTQGEEHVPIEDILDVLEASLSAKAYGALSREEESIVLSQACSTPRSPCEVVDAILRGVAERFPQLSEDARIAAQCSAMEPLFTFESTARVELSFGELKKGSPWA